MNIQKFHDSFLITGCRLHANDDDCRGPLMICDSIYGARLECCAGAAKILDGEIWVHKKTKTK